MKSSNKALHHYGAQGAPRVNADVRFMMMKAIRIQFLILCLGIVSLTLPGCGTIVTLPDGGKPKSIPYIYSGVMTEWELLSASHNTEWRLPWWAQTLIVLDLPLSAVGDTAVLPFTATRAFIEIRNKQSNKGVQAIGDKSPQPDP